MKISTPLMRVNLSLSTATFPMFILSTLKHLLMLAEVVDLDA
jgi:hypothetical protein